MLFKGGVFTLYIGFLSVFGANSVAVDAEEEVAKKAWYKALHTAVVKVQEGPFEIASEKRGITFNGFDARLFELVLMLHDRLGNTEAMKVLDYACGTGKWAAAAVLLAEKMGRRMWADASDPFLEAAHQTYYSDVWKAFAEVVPAGVSDFRLTKGALEDVAEADYNVVILRDAIHLFSKAERNAFFAGCREKAHENGFVIVGVGVPFYTILKDARIALLAGMKGLSKPTFADVYAGKSRDFLTKMFAGNESTFSRLAAKAVGVSEVIQVAKEEGWELRVATVDKQLLVSKEGFEFEEKVLFDWLKSLFEKGSVLEMLHLGFGRALPVVAAAAPASDEVVAPACVEN